MKKLAKVIIILIFCGSVRSSMDNMHESDDRDIQFVTEDYNFDHPEVLVSNQQLVSTLEFPLQITKQRVPYQVYQEDLNFTFQIDLFGQQASFNNWVSIQAILTITSDLISNKDIIFAYREGEFPYIKSSSTIQQTLIADYVDYNGQDQLFYYFHRFYLKKKQFYIIINTSNIHQIKPQYVSVIQSSKFPLDYELTLVASYQPQCPLGCSNNGKCVKLINRYVCDCNMAFLDADCSVPGIQLQLNEEIRVYPNVKDQYPTDSNQYIYFQPDDQQEGDLRLSVNVGDYTNFPPSELILVMKTEYTGKISLPTTDEYDFITPLNQLSDLQIEIKNNVIGYMDDLRRRKKIIIVIIPSLNIFDTPSVYVDIKISGRTPEEEESMVLMIIYILIGILGGLIIIGIAIYVIRKKQLSNLRQIPGQNPNRGLNGRQQQQKPPNTLNEDDINKFIPKIDYNNIQKKYEGLSHQNISEENNCSVCLNEYEIGQTFRQTPCMHIFHQQCIEQWLGKHENCPLCRQSLSKTDIQKYLEEKKNKQQLEAQQEVVIIIPEEVQQNSIKSQIRQ